MPINAFPGACLPVSPYGSKSKQAIGWGQTAVGASWLFFALAAAFACFSWAKAARAGPQDSRANAPAAESSENAVTRGKYLVQGVAMCGDCHTPPGLSGVPDRSKWLMGVPVTPEPPSPAPDWPTMWLPGRLADLSARLN